MTAQNCPIWVPRNGIYIYIYIYIYTYNHPHIHGFITLCPSFVATNWCIILIYEIPLHQFILLVSCSKFLQYMIFHMSSVPSSSLMFQLFFCGKTGSFTSPRSWLVRRRLRMAASGFLWMFQGMLPYAHMNHMKYC